MPFSAELAASGLQRPQVKNYQDCCLIYQILPMILLDSIKQTYSMGIILTLYQLSIKKNIHTRYIFSFFPPDSCNVAVRFGLENPYSAWLCLLPTLGMYILTSILLNP